MDKKVTVSFSLRSLILIGLSLVVLALAYYVRDVIILFVLSYILASAMRPFVSLLAKYKIPKIISIVLLFAALIGIVYFVFRVLVPPVVTQVNSLVNNRQELVADAERYFHLLPDEIEGNVGDYVDELPEKARNLFFNGSILEGALGLFAGFGGLLTVIIVSFYMLLENSSFEKTIATVWPGQTKEKERVQRALKQVDLKVSMWVRGQLILSLAIGALTFIGLSILGVPYALVLAIIAAFTELIPYAGPIIGAVPAIIIALLVSPLLALWVILLTVAIQQFENHVLVPQVMKRAVGLSAVMVIFSILVGAKLFGVLGAIIAVPVAASVKVLSESIKGRG